MPVQVTLPGETTSALGFEFEVPDLSGPEAARAAHRAGITATELSRLRRAQQSGASNAQLARLDEQIMARAAARRGR